MNLPEISVKRRVAMFMVFVAVLLIGGIVLFSLKLDLLPDIEPPVVNILTTWPGASASDVEQRVTKTIEDSVALIEGVDTVTSRSMDNISAVSVKFKWSEDLDVKMGEIRDAVNMAKRDLPDDAEEPVLLRVTSGSVPILVIALTADRSYEGLYHFADRVVVETISKVPGVGHVLLNGGLKREIHVLVDAGKIEACGIPVSAVIAAVERENLNVPAGSLKQGGTEYFIRIPGRFTSVEEIGRTVVGVSGGRTVSLSDVADVEDTYKDQDVKAYFMDRKSVILVVLKTGGANTVEVSNAVLGRLEELKKSAFPSDVEYSTVMNTSEFILNSIRNLSRSLFAGIALVFIVTWLFLKRLSASMIVCGSIPFSLVITFIFMGELGYTINIFTLSALAMASGMVVDNCIVSTDQIVHHLENGARKSVASVIGTVEVQSAMTASTLTTVVVLLPLAFMSGLVGVFFSSLTVVMVAAVTASLFVSLTFVPMMAGIFFRKEEDRFRIHRYSDMFISKMERGYLELLGWALGNRVAVILMGFLLLALTVVSFRIIGTELTPEPDTGEISITMTMPEGTMIDVTDTLVRKTMKFVRENVPEAVKVYGFEGRDEKGFASAVGQESGPNIGSVGLKLVDKKERKRSALQVGEDIRKWLRTQPGIEKSNVLVTSPIKSMFLGSKPLNLEVFGDDLDEVLAVSERLRGILRSIPGTVDVSISQKQNRPEIWVEADREKASMLGVNTALIAQSLRTYFYGYETSENYWEGEDDYPIRFRLREEQRNSRDIFNRLMVPSASGKMIRLSTVAQPRDTMGPPEIQRKNKQRYVVVESNVHGRSLGDVTRDTRYAVQKLEIPQGVSIEFGGQVKEQADAFRQMALLVLLGVILVYMVMAGQYEAYLDPFVILFSIPFSLTGVALAYLVTGLYISLQALLGIVMLVGIVVNNAIILVDYINLLRARGSYMEEALIQAGARRLRPVLMTSLTTFSGMLPMALSRAIGSEIWKPLAVSVMGGLLVSTLVTLVFVPVMYSIFEEKVRRTGRFREGVNGR